MDRPKPRRGWVSLYAVAFALMAVAGVLVAVAALDKLTDDSLRLLRISAGLSGVSIVVAVASVLVPRRR
jgi:hypothetical protein